MKKFYRKLYYLRNLVQLLLLLPILQKRYSCKFAQRLKNVKIKSCKNKEVYSMCP